MKRLKLGTDLEMKRMKKDCAFVDRFLAERFALANLIENPDYYGLSGILRVFELEYFSLSKYRLISRDGQESIIKRRILGLG